MGRQRITGGWLQKQSSKGECCEGLKRGGQGIIRPVEDYDALTLITKEVIHEGGLVELLRVVRLWHVIGVPIGKYLRMIETRVTVDVAWRGRRIGGG
jgi:hypothetical protein